MLGVPASFWNNLEAIYREKLVRVEAENAMDDDIALARQFPYAEMAELGWVPKTRDIRERVINLRKFFEVVTLSILENRQVTRIACRRLGMTEKKDLSLMAWAQEARRRARNVRTEPISVRGLLSIIPDLRKSTVLMPEDFCPIIKKALSDCGIALVFLPQLKGLFLQGATFYDGDRIVVGLTVQGKDADRFWIGLFHELAHIVLGHIGKPDGTSDDDEKAADAWAKKMLIDEDMFVEFVKSDDYSESGVIDFAKKQGIAPGIVVGRMRVDRLIKYNSKLSSLIEEYEIPITSY